MDAEVRIRGACGAIFNNKLQLVGILLYVPGMQQIEVLKAPEDPFAKADTGLETVARFAPNSPWGIAFGCRESSRCRMPRRSTFPTEAPDCVSILRSRWLSGLVIGWMWLVFRACPITR